MSGGWGKEDERKVLERLVTCSFKHFPNSENATQLFFTFLSNLHPSCLKPRRVEAPVIEKE
jgi:hypothetical protein